MVYFNNNFRFSNFKLLYNYVIDYKIENFDSKERGKRRVFFVENVQKMKNKSIRSRPKIKGKKTSKFQENSFSLVLIPTKYLQQWNNSEISYMFEIEMIHKALGFKYACGLPIP